MSAETEAYLDKVREKYGEIEVTSAGSSLKLCLVAEGQADVYPRFAPTMEWDTCAGQVIVEQAGGKVVQVDTGQSLIYNKENLLNPCRKRTKVRIVKLSANSAVGFIANYECADLFAKVNV